MRNHTCANLRSDRRRQGQLVGARAPPARGRLALAHVCHQHCLLGCVCGGIADGITAGTLVAWMALKSRPPAGSTALQLARLHLRTDGHGLHLCLGHQIGGSRGFDAGTCGSSGCGECSARGRDAGTRVERRLCHFGWVGGEPAAPWWWCEAHEGDKKRTFTSESSIPPPARALVVAHELTKAT